MDKSNPSVAIKPTLHFYSLKTHTTQDTRDGFFVCFFCFHDVCGETVRGIERVVVVVVVVVVVFAKFIL